MIAVADAYAWSRKSLEELVAFYEREIGDAMVSEGMDPTADRPTYEWLADRGYSGIAYALREQHGLTLSEFLTDCVGVDPPESDGYDWRIGDAETVDRLEQYLDSRSRRHNLADATIRSRRSRLARYAREYERLHGDARLVERAGSIENQPAEIDRAIAVFDELSRELESADSKFAHLTDANDWYLWLQNRMLAAFNPMVNVRNEFSKGWRAERADESGTKPALSAAQVRRLHRAAESDAERFMVVALGAWGLRRSEVASLHASAMDPDPDPPRLTFAERKNGPGTVQVLFGTEAYADRVAALEDGEGGDREWNGYLFPSGASASGHIAPGTVNNRFDRLAERAGVTLDGERPTPHACRRFWYNAYLRASRAALEQASVVGAEQGSSSAEVVLENYIDDEQALAMRREHMRATLAEAFDADDDGG